MDKQLIEKCTAYFKSEPILRKLIEGLICKYTSYSTVAGSVTFTKLSEQDVEILEGLFQTNYHGKKTVTISSNKVQKVLDNSKYKGIQVVDILLEYNGKPLLGNKEIQEDYARRQQQYFKMFYESKNIEKNIFGKWMQYVFETKVPPYKSLIQKYNENVKKLSETLKHIEKALNNLPILNNEYMYLAVFASEITGDPHYFDEGTQGMIFLSYGIIFYVENMQKLNRQCTKIDEFEKFKSKKKNELLCMAGIIKDDISNYTIAYGIRGWKKDESEHKGIKGYFDEQEPIQLSMITIANIEKVEPISKEVFIVENPSVFLELVKIANGKIALMCMNGQPKLSSIFLANKLVKSGAKLYYSGDFDPEGIKIADRLKSTYNENLELWGMDCETYVDALSDVKIDERRLKILDTVECEILRKIGEKMKKYKKSAYQEKIIVKLKKKLLVII